jgi:predicted RecA/RadA family phage recombinase
MAKNVIYEDADQLEVLVTVAPGARVASGDPVLSGFLPAVALTDGTDTVANSGVATCKFNGAAEFTVYGYDGAADLDIAAGDIVYNDRGVLNANARTGVRFGYALAPVVRGRRTAIRVKIGY